MSDLIYINDIRDLASALHEATCKVSSEHCRWDAEEELAQWPWTKPLHIRYIDRASEMVEKTGLPPAQIVKVLEAL